MAVPRWARVALVVASVLALTGYGTYPYLKDWWIGREVCGGALPDGAVDALGPGSGAHLVESSEESDKEYGRYRCTLTHDRGKGGDGPPMPVFEVTADTRAATMGTVFIGDEGWEDVEPLPDGMPGLLAGDAVVLTRKCPELGKGDDGRARRLTVRTAAAGAKDSLVDVAAAATNRASRELGCGAEPVERTGPVHPEADPVAPAKTRGTACAVFAGAGLPAGIEVRVRSNSASPMVRCDLVRRGGSVNGPKGSFGAWYGDWTERIAYDRELGKRRAGYATARCDGEAAAFSGWADDELGLSERRVRKLVADFTAAQVKQRGCTGLTAPAGRRS